MGFGFIIRFIEHLQNITTNNYYSLTELHTLKITVTTAHIKSSQSSLVVAWQQLPMADVHLLEAVSNEMPLWESTSVKILKVG
jgi:hypothetical protein